ncbi:helix-turn-helix domain-containing protein [Nannocystis bainbridge]|uniref:Helix-turn-helix domain-containing protein n=1 Tax=Nannocystis bainbridge TaxID=2995303 RepID=A0ABT5DQV0_9BACT|nr:helix-turn-helix domain-containing protein [Nannocystis bainbridge]MDC0716010.1 helix-turn-helix domain-containing protein [Nannocystis bainbridge]
MDDDTVPMHLGNNVRQLREARGLTQQQIARVAGLPRPTWANLESGAANPTLAVLIKVAAALQVSLEELISPPRTTSKFYAAATLPTRQRGKVRVRRLLPEPIVGLELERMELPAGASMSGIPHTPGTREYLTCERGEIELSESGRVWKLGPGDVVVFRGDQPHGYRNAGGASAIAYSVITLAPPAG